MRIHLERLLSVLERRCIYIEKFEDKPRLTVYELSNGAYIEHYLYTGEFHIKGDPQAARYLDIALNVDESEREAPENHLRKRCKTFSVEHMFIPNIFIVMEAIHEMPSRKIDWNGDNFEIYVGDDLYFHYKPKSKLLINKNNFQDPITDTLFFLAEKSLLKYTESSVSKKQNASNYIQKYSVGDYEFIWHNCFRKGYCHIRFRNQSLTSVDMIEELAICENHTFWRFCHYPDIVSNEFVGLMNFFEKQIYPNHFSRLFPLEEESCYFKPALATAT